MVLKVQHGISSSPFWTYSSEEILSSLNVSPLGLSSQEAEDRLEKYGRNEVSKQRKDSSIRLFLSQFSSPFILILLFAASLSLFLRDATDAFIILSIVVISGVLGFIQEKGASDVMSRLLKMVAVTSRVLRDGTEQEILLYDVVPGDIVLLKAGDVVPADCLLIEARDLFVDEASFTEESFSVEKAVGVAPQDAPLRDRKNILYMGTHITSGFAKAVAVKTGSATEFGGIFSRLAEKAPETAFEKGVRQFGNFLMQVTLLLVLGIFLFTLFLQRPLFDSFLFALALAVGLTPQLLPAIITINLSKGAKAMANKRVVVKKLSSIENLGNMDVLCADKTGTLTKGDVELYKALDARGEESTTSYLFGYINAFFQTGHENILDRAIVRHKPMDISDWVKLDEIPYDFVRKRVSVLAKRNEDVSLIIIKGAFEPVLSICSRVLNGGENPNPIEPYKKELMDEFAAWSEKGFRVLGLAVREDDGYTTFTVAEEREMTFFGFLIFYDPPKKDAQEVLDSLREKGIATKIITGDNRLVSLYIASSVGIREPRVLTGKELAVLSDEALTSLVRDIDLFAEIEPNQKERLIIALKRSGHTVGFLGDGVNDVTALHAADIGISVDSAIDAAKSGASIVLLEKNLSVLLDGVVEGRKTFANTMKYMFMATSANFGNMFSMAGGALMFTFLPLLPKQILLTNLLSDFPEMCIATDSVDREMVEKPCRWDVSFLRSFMLVFGLISSIFDYTTFWVLFELLKAPEEEFRTGWFIESIISAATIVLLVRTRRPFYKSLPSCSLMGMVAVIVVFTIFLPWSPLAPHFGLVPLPGLYFMYLGAILLLYMLSVEIAKRWFYKHR